MKKYVLVAFIVLMASTEVFALKANIIIATGIKDRVPQGESEVFPASTESLVGWTHIRGAKEPISVFHVWIKDGEEVGNIELDVKSASFRTWSEKTVLDQPGQWTFELRDIDGNVIAKKEFLIK